MDYLASFSKNLEGRHASKVTIKNYVADIRKFIRFIQDSHHRDFTLSDFTTDTIAGYKSYLQSTQTSISSQERYLSSLRKFASFLHEEHKIPFNPFSASNMEKKEIDLWAISQFKQNLILHKASDLTVKNYILDIKQFLSWVEEVDKNISKENPYASLTTDVIEEYKSRLLDEMQLSPLSVNRKLSSIRKYASFLAQSDRLSSQPLIYNIGEVIQNTSEDNKELHLNHDTLSSETSGAEGEQEVVTKEMPYSSFAPVRLSQKLGKLVRLGFDAALILPIIALIEKASLLVRKSQGSKGLFEETQIAKKSIFSGISHLANIASKKESISQVRSFIVSNPATAFKGKITNLSKSFYAPLDISTSNLPRHKKIMHHLRYTRPNWYKKYHTYAITHYFHFAILMIFITVIGASMYSVFFDSGRKSPALAALPTAPPRILSFQGRLTDASDNPITATRNVRFAIYDDITASGSGHILWQELQGVSPDQDGVFSVLMGNTGSSCGSPLTPATGPCSIPSTLFSQNASLYLGITIENDTELTPRQQVASVAYAVNSETLQGLPPSTAGGAGTTNVVLALDSSGNLTIGGSATPTFQASGGQFTLSGTVLNLTTTAGSNTNVQVNPDGSGKIDLQKAIINSTLNGPLPTAAGAVQIDDLFAVNATSSGQSAFTLNQDSTGPLISASASGVSKFLVSNTGGGYFAGSVGIGSTTPGATLDVVGSLRASSAITFTSFNNNGGLLYTNGSGAVAQTIVGSSGQCLQSVGGGTPVWGTCGSGAQWTIGSGVIYPVNNTLDLLLGGTATNSARIGLININSGNPTATLSGNFSLSSPTGSAPTVTQNVLNGGTLNFQTSVGGDAGLGSRLFIANNGNIGISTTASSSKLDIQSTAVNTDVQRWMATDGSRLGRFTETSGGAGWFEVDNASGVAQALLRGDGGVSYITGGNVGIGTTAAANFALQAAGNIGPSATNTYDLGSSSLQWNNIYGNNFYQNGTLVNLTNYWQRALGAVAPYNITDDVLVGGSATASAKIRLGGTTNADSFFNTGGNVGIGTTGPASPLHVYENTANVGATAGLTIQQAGAGNAALHFIETGNWSMGVRGNTFRLVANASLGTSPIMYVNTSGQMALNSASPIGGLRVLYDDGVSASNHDILVAGQGTSNVRLGYIANGSAITGGFVRSDNSLPISMCTTSTCGTSGGGITLLDSGNVGINTTTPLGRLNVVGSSAAPIGKAALVLIQNETNGDLFTASAGATTRFVINNAGNVGIGTSLPASLLNIEASSVGTASLVRLRNSSAGVNQTRLDLNNDNGSGANSGASLFYTSTTYGAGFNSTLGFWNYLSGNIVFATANNERLRIDSTGNVGIGTTAPLAPLDVNGAASASGSLTFRAGAASIQATTNSPLTIGGNSTGNITLAPFNTTAGGAVVPAATNVTDLGTSALQFRNVNAQNYYQNGVLVNVTNYWQRALGAVAPYNITDDVLVGGTATASALIKFPGLTNNDAFFNLGTGNLGVGTTTPGGKIQVNGSASGIGIIVRNNATTPSDLLQLQNSGGTTIGKITSTGQFVINNSNSDAAIAGGASMGLGVDGSNNVILRSNATINLSNSTAVNVPSALNFVNNASGTLSVNNASALSITQTNLSGSGAFTSIIKAGGAQSTNDIFQVQNSSAAVFVNVNSSGNLGIGTTSPFGKLNVVGNSTNPIGKAALVLIQNETNGDILTASAGATTRFVITNNGNVGIGSSLPASALEVNTPSAASSITIDGNSSTVGSSLSITDKLTAGNIYTALLNPSGTAGTNLNTIPFAATFSTGTNTSGGIYFVSKAASAPIVFATGGVTLSNERMRIDSAGNVGLGTTNPASFKLQVAGHVGPDANNTYDLGSTSLQWRNLYVGGSLCFAGGTDCLTSFAAAGTNFWNLSNGALQPKNSTVDLLVGGTGTSSATFGFINVNSGTPTATISGNFGLQVPSGSAPAVSENILNGGKLDIKTSVGGDAGLASRFTILNNGNVGIGTSTPGGFFSVGTSSQFIINNTGTVTAGTWNGTAIGAQYGGTGINTSASTGVPSISSGTWSVASTLATTLGGLGANVTAAGAGELLYSTSTSAYGHLAAGTSGQALLSGGTGAPSWANTNTSAFGLWDLLTGGVLTPKNATTDLLLGGTATTSARIAFINIAGGNPTASLSGNFAIASPTGAAPASTFSILNGGSFNFKTSVGGDAGLSTKFSIGNDGTLTASKFTTNGGLLYTDASGVFNQTAAGSLGQCLQSAGGGSPVWGGCGGIQYWASSNGALYPANTTMDLLIGGTATTSAKFAFTNVNSGNPTLKIYDSTSTNYVSINHDGTNANIVASTGTINIGAGGGTTYFNTDILNDSTNNGGFIKISDRLLVQAGAGANGNALAIFDNTTPGDILTASASGVTKFVIDGSGNVGIGTTTPSNFMLQVAGNVGPQTTNTYDLGSLSLQWRNIYGQHVFSNGIELANYWQLNSGALAPQNITNDILLGSTATASATVRFGATTNADSFFNTGGNLGIGTTAPAATLDVVKSANSVTYPVNIANINVGSSAGVGQQFLLSLSGGSAERIAASIQTLKSGTWTTGTAGTVASDLAFSVRFNDVLNEQMRLTGAGNLGIGTSNPLGLLNVNGSTTTTQGQPLVLFNQTGTSDIINASTSGSIRFRLTNGGSIYASDFYDINNTGYFLDPAGVTMAASLSAELRLDYGGVNLADPSINGSSVTTYSGAGKGNFFSATGSLITAYGSIGRGENYLRYSEQLDQYGGTDAAPWVKGANLSVTTGISDVAAPNGTLTIEKLTATNTTNTTIAQVYRRGTLGATATNYTFSVWIRNGHTGEGGSTVNPVTGTINITLSDGTTTKTTPINMADNMTSGWNRYFVTSSVANTATIITATIDLNGNNGKDIYAWGAQLEQQSSVGSYVRTSSQRETTTLGGLIATGTGPSVIMSGNDGIATPSASTLLVAGSGGVYNGGSSTSKNILQIYSNITGATNNSADIGFLANRPGPVGNIPTNIASISAILTNATGNAYTGDLAFATAGTAAAPTERMRITSNGNVGIGTTAPTSVGGGGSPKVLQIHNNGSNAYGNLVLSGNSTTSGEVISELDFATTGSAGEKRAAAIASFLSGTSTSNAVGDMRFYTANGGAVGEKMRIKADGNIGVGNTNPGSLLFVGSGSIASGPLTGLNVGIATAAYISASDGTRTAFMGADSSGYSMFGSLTNNAVGIRVNNGLKVYIDTAGNVGIGTSTVGQKLQVEGNVYAHGGYLYTTDGSNGLVQAQNGNLYLRPVGSGNSVNMDTGPTNVSGGALNVSGGSITNTGSYSWAGNQIMDGTTSWLRTYGSTGWFNGTYSGGWYMIDTTWIRSYNSKGVYMDAGFDTGSPAGVGCGGGLGAGYTLRVCGTTNSTTATYSPIYYDLDNTAYYTNPASASSMNTVWANNLFGNATTVTFTQELHPEGGDNRYTVGTSAHRYSQMHGVDIYGAYHAGPDVAEKYKSNDSLEPGELTSWDGNKITRATASNSANLAGVISSNPGVTLTDMSGYDESGYPLALVGRVPVKVSSENGQVQAGDYLTISSTPGVAMKATKFSKVIGRALEAYTGSEESQGVYEHMIKPNTTPDPYTPVPATNGIGKIMVFVGVTLYDPDIYITDAGNLNIASTSAGFVASNTTNGSIISKIGSFATAVIANLQAGAISASQISTNIFQATTASIGSLTTQSLSIATSNVTIAGQNINDFIDARVNALLDSRISQLTSPLASTSATVTAGRIVIRPEIATSEPVLDVTGNASISGSLAANNVTAQTATVSGQLSANGLSANNATISGTLHATNIEADNITALSARIATLSATTIVNNFNTTIATMSGDTASTSADLLASLYSNGIQTNFANIASLSAQQAYVPTLSSDFLTANQGLVALGPSSLADTSVTGQLSVNGNLIISDSGINVLGGDLQIQPLLQGGVQFEGGQIAFDTDGNIRVNGNGTFGKDVQVAGTLSSKYISALPGQDLNINLPGSSSLAVNNASGSAVFKINQIGDVIASGSGTFKDLLANGLNIVRGAQADDSITETTASGSAGTAIINANQTERTVYTPYVSEKSLIYITPTSDTQGVTPYIARQTAEDPDNRLGNGPTRGSFTIVIPQNVSSDIKLNWWIVN
jgi:site-specific recombinase XerD